MRLYLGDTSLVLVVLSLMLIILPLILSLTHCHMRIGAEKTLYKPREIFNSVRSSACCSVSSVVSQHSRNVSSQIWLNLSLRSTIWLNARIKASFRVSLRIGGVIQAVSFLCFALHCYTVWECHDLLPYN